ncbi:MAG: UPF0175 family protein [Betaproteobacteria bacterium]|nr:UPF0175 family protein [Betaproteobacteria bacterium]
MHTLTTDEMRNEPQNVLADARRGEPALIVENGEPVLMTIPMGQGLEAREVRLELAVGLFDREQVSLGIAARIAGLSIEEMIDELGRRLIPVVRYRAEEFEEEMKYVRTLADRG